MFRKINFHDEFYMKLKTLVLPITIQQFMLALVSTTDAVMLGAVSQTALSAVSLAGQIQFVLNLFISGISAGCGIMAAQYWGKGDADSIEAVIPIALRTNLIFSGIFTLAAAGARDKRSGISSGGSLFLSAVWDFADLSDFAQKYGACSRLLKNQFYRGGLKYYFECGPDFRIVWLSGVRHCRGGVCNGDCAARGVDLELHRDKTAVARARHLEENVLQGGSDTLKGFLALYNAGTGGGSGMGNRICILLRDHGAYGQ